MFSLSFFGGSAETPPGLFFQRRGASNNTADGDNDKTEEKIWMQKQTTKQPEQRTFSSLCDGSSAQSI